MAYEARHPNIGADSDQCTWDSDTCPCSQCTFDRAYEAKVGEVTAAEARRYEEICALAATPFYQQPCAPS